MSLWEKLLLKHDYNPLPNKKWLIYTCNIGGYDDFKGFADSLNIDLIEKNLCSINDIDFRIYVDVDSKQHELKYKNWEIIKVPFIKSKFEEKDSYLTSRKYKLSIDHIYTEYYNSLYIDCNCRLNSAKIFNVLSRFEKRNATNHKNIINDTVDMMGLKHTKHQDYDSEANHAGGRLSQHRKDIISNQRNFYNKSKDSNKIKTMPFITGRFLVRKHTPSIKELCNFWYGQAEKWTHRDQVSWQYAYHKKGLGKISLDMISDSVILNSRDLNPGKHQKK